MAPARLAWVYAGITVVLWSTVAAAFEIALRRLSPAAVLLGATSVALLTQAALLARRGRLRAALAATRAAWRRSLVLGAVNPALYYLVLLEAYARLPGQVAQPVNYTWAITLALLAVPVLGQPLRPAELAAMAVSYAGVVVIATGGDPAALATDDLLGVGLALASTVLWAGYWLASARDAREPMTATFGNFLAGWPLIAAAWWLTDGTFERTGETLGAVVWLGLAEMGITFVTWLTALRLAESTARIATLIFAAPFLSLLWLSVFAGEPIRPATPPGLVLLAAGLLWQQRLRSHPPR